MTLQEIFTQKGTKNCCSHYISEVCMDTAILVLDQIRNLFDITYVLTLLTMIIIKKRIDLDRTKFQEIV